MDQTAVRIADVDEGDVEVVGDDGVAADGAHELGLSQPIKEDREVVRSEVTHDTGVRLMDSQVDPARGPKVDSAQIAGLDQVLNRAHRRRIQEGVARHEDKAAPVGKVDEAL